MSDNIVEITNSSNYSVSIETSLDSNNNVSIECSNSSNHIGIINNTTVLVGDLPQGYPLGWTSGNLPVSRVSGLNIVGGSGISVANNSGIFTVAVTGAFGLTGEQVDDRVGNLLIGGSYTNLNYNDNNDTLTISVTGLQPSGNYSLVGHAHTSNNITDFNSSVSGLLPVKNISSGSGISITNTSGNFTVSVTGTFGLTSEQVDDRVSNLLVGSNYITLNYDDNLDTLTIGTSGLQPSGNYSIVGHSHNINDINNLQSNLDLKAPILNPTFSGTVSGITKNMIGLSNVDNTNDLDKPVSNSQLSAISGAQNYAVQRGNHTGTQLVSTISDFNSSVSGLLPVTNITGGSYVNISSSSGVYSIQINGLQPSGNYSFVGHSHSTSDITNFNSSVSGLVNGIYAPLNSPSLTGTPTAPTASSGTNNTQIANTQFVRNEISNLVNSAPSTLDTLNELAAALGNDPNFATTIASGLATKSNIGHTHTASNITDFNSSVSGLLPVTNVTGSSGIVVGKSGTIYNVTSSGLAFTSGANFSSLSVTGVPVSISGHQHSYTDITNWASGIDNTVSTLLVAGNYINLVYDNTYDTLTINTSGLQPSGSYANSIHSHGNISSSGTIGSTSGLLVTTTANGVLTTSSGITSSYISDFNNSVSGLLPVKNVLGNGYVNVNSSSGSYTISVSGLQPSGNYSVVGHSHTSSNITDFNASVSGLLPLVSGSGYTTLNFANNTYTISVTGLQPSGNYSVVGHTHASSNITDFNSSVSGLLPVTNLTGGNYINISNSGTNFTISSTGLQPSGNYSLVGHSHTSSNISDFNSSVSGLLPVTNILAGSNIGVSNSGSVFTVAVTGQLGLTTEEVDDRVATLLVAGTGIDLTYNDNLNTLVITSVGSSPSGNYALAGHTHTSSQITDFNSSVSGLLPVTSILGGSNITVSQSGTAYTVAVTGSLGLTTEEVDDRVAALLVAGSGIGLNYNDPANTLTISVSGLSSTAQVGNGTSGVITYDLGTPLNIVGSGNTTISYNNSSKTVTIGTPLILGEIRSDTINNVNYIGRAVAGSSESSEVWTVKRYTISTNGIDITSATANNIAWTNHLSASYS